MRQHLSHDGLAQLILHNLQLVRRLEVQPELGRGTEVARQAQRERLLMRRDGQRDEKRSAWQGRPWKKPVAYGRSSVSILSRDRQEAVVGS